MIAIGLALSWQEHSSPNTMYSTCLLVSKVLFIFVLDTVRLKAGGHLSILKDYDPRPRRGLDNDHGQTRHIYTDRNGTLGPVINTLRFDLPLPCFKHIWRHNTMLKLIPHSCQPWKSSFSWSIQTKQYKGTAVPVIIRFVGHETRVDPAQRHIVWWVRLRCVDVSHISVDHLLKT